MPACSSKLSSFLRGQLGPIVVRDTQDRRINLHVPSTVPHGVRPHNFRSLTLPAHSTFSFRLESPPIVIISTFSSSPTSFSANMASSTTPAFTPAHLRMKPPMSCRPPVSSSSAHGRRHRTSEATDPRSCHTNAASRKRLDSTFDRLCRIEEAPNSAPASECHPSRQSGCQLSRNQ
jgi:hypothetical protein